MVTERDKKVIQRIINVFETSNPLGDYGLVTLLPNDPGGLTYGRSQTTLNSGNLQILLEDYLDKRLAPSEIEGYYSVPAMIIQSLMRDIRIKNRQLNEPNVVLHALLRILGEDPYMRWCQDEFFDEAYWEPAAKKAKELGFTTPLAYAVVYDGYVHGSFGLIRQKFPERAPSSGGDEKKWVRQYVDARYTWLKSKPYLAATVYRMEAFAALILADNWSLTTPFKVRGTTVNDN